MKMPNFEALKARTKKYLRFAHFLIQLLAAEVAIDNFDDFSTFFFFRVVNASAEGASKNFRVSCTTLSYDVTEWAHRSTIETTFAWGGVLGTGY